MAITDEQLAEWKRLCAEASPGPWIEQDDYGRVLVMSDARDGAPFRHDVALLRENAEGEPVVGEELPFEQHSVNARFIAQAREALPALLAEVERLRGWLGAFADEARMARPARDCGRLGSAGAAVLATVVRQLATEALAGDPAPRKEGT